MGPRYPWFCVAFILAWSLAWGIAPNYRTVWLYENLLVFAGVPLLIWLHRKWPLSNPSWTLITLFLALHTVGAHYTYSEVPLFDRIQEWGGFSRNHYDRVIHFSFGLLLAYPLREFFIRTTRVRGFWAWFVPLSAIMSASVAYEFMEWTMMMLVDPSAGDAFLGAQGDPWDGHKDMALATCGALLTLTVAHFARVPRGGPTAGR